MKIDGPDAIMQATDPDGCPIPMRWRRMKEKSVKNHADPVYKSPNEDWFCDQCLEEWGYTMTDKAGATSTDRAPPKKTVLQTFGFGGDENKLHTFKQV